jgi:hypothetical protein
MESVMPDYPVVRALIERELSKRAVLLNLVEESGVPVLPVWMRLDSQAERFALEVEMINYGIALLQEALEENQGESHA